MKKKNICLLLAVIFTFAAMPVLADASYATFSATQCVNAFTTYNKISRPDNATWDSDIVVTINTFTSSGDTKVKIRAINDVNIIMGEFYCIESTGNHHIYLYDDHAQQSYSDKKIGLFVKNNNGGYNIVISGSWMGLYE